MCHFFSGGNLEKAIRTVMKYKDDPGYVPSEDELKMMANFVITHGGRAILNDVVLRGYVHALGGFFQGGDLRHLLRENVSSLIRRKKHS